MKARHHAGKIDPHKTGGRGAEAGIPQLVARVYESAPPADRKRLLEHLMRPLGVLSLAVVGNGIFSKLRFRSGWELNLQPEDLKNVRIGDVIDLADHAQKASAEAIDGLIGLLSTSPVLAGSAAATLLLAALVQQARSRNGGLAGARDPFGQ